jgi:uncharacterized membrane protein
MAETVTQPRKPLSSRWRWVLIASLCLNLALIGLGVGARLNRPTPPPPPGLWNYGRALPEPYRENLSHALRATRHDWIGPREALRGQREALAEALVATPYDPVAVAEVITREPRLMDTLAQRGSQLLLDQISRMTPQDRAAYAEVLRRAPKKGEDRQPPPPKD